MAKSGLVPSIETVPHSALLHAGYELKRDYVGEWGIVH